jgi:hypothetical protein
LRFMKFANIQDIGGYAGLLSENGCKILAAEDTQRFAAYLDLYMKMVDMQLTYDALRIIGFNMTLMHALAADFAFLQALAHAGKIAQGRFIARRN